MKHIRLLAPLLVFSLFGFGCQVGSAEFHTLAGDIHFAPEGTVFAWTEPLNGHTSVNVLMTWITIDPHRDLNDFGADRVQQISGEFLARDRLHLRFLDKDDLQKNRSFQSGRALQADVHFEGKGIGNERTVDCTIDDVVWENGNGYIKGRIEIWVRPKSDDPIEAKSGRIHVRFEAPFVRGPEIPLKNFALLTGAKI